MAEENKKVLKETLEEPTEEETSSDNKDIIEIEWEEIEKVYALRNELQELEQYLSQAFINFEKTKSAVMNRIISAEGRMYNTAEELKTLKGVPPETPYELKMPTTEGQKAYFVKREE